MKVYKHGAGIAIVDDGTNPYNRRVLLGKRSDGQGWSMAGGKKEPGETSLETALRELKEEFGIELSKDDINIGEFNRFFGEANIKGQKIMAVSKMYIYFKPENKKLEFHTSPEFTEIRWFTLEEILTEIDHLFPITNAILNAIFYTELDDDYTLDNIKD